MLARASLGFDLPSKKKQLLSEIAPLERGLRAKGQERAKIERLCGELEKRNPNPKPLGSKLVNGRWKLVYTTSESILGTNRLPFLRPAGPIYQIIDAPGLRARNVETWPWFSEVTADLTPVDDSEVNVQFDTFKLLGFIPVKAPPSAKGSLKTTFLDEEIRISRGDKGNLFVLVMDDRSMKP